MEAEIRLATLDDVQQIAELQIDAWQQAYRGLMPEEELLRQEPARRAEQWSSHLNDPERSLLLAAAGPRLYGFCSLCPSRDADAAASVAEIAAIYVHPLAWRKGYGSSLLNAARSVAAQRGFLSLTLWVLEANQAARAFYEARGFQLDGQTKALKIAGSDLANVRYVTTLEAHA